MRYRPLLAAASVATLLAVLPAHAAAPKTLDGKKTKVLTFTATSAPQDHDSNVVTDVPNGLLKVKTPVDRPADFSKCPSGRCLTYSFVYKPAKGVKRAPFSVRVSWTIPGQDYDLYVFQGGGDAGHCGASAGTSEVVVVDSPVPGKTYKVVVDEFRAGPDTVTGKISFPAKDKIGTTAPPQPDSKGLPVNCGLS
jgi:hypothetical protein